MDATTANAAATSTGQPPPTSGALFAGFLWLGMIGFGGVLPMSRQMLVEKKRWLTGPEFTDLLGLCQFLPGGNIINMSVAVGMHFRGVRGALAALIGLIAMPTLVVVLLGMVYDRFQNDPHIQHMFAGLAAAAAGLLVQMAVKVAWPLRGNPAGIVIAVLCFVAIAVLRLPLLPTMLVLATLSILAAKRWAR
jgi:chromate transporter